VIAVLWLVNVIGNPFLQFCESMQKILKTISIFMASFSEVYYGNGGLLARATSSVWTGKIHPVGFRKAVNIVQHLIFTEENILYEIVSKRVLFLLQTYNVCLLRIYIIVQHWRIGAHCMVDFMSPQSCNRQTLGLIFYCVKCFVFSRMVINCCNRTLHFEWYCGNISLTLS
jgi:hypothetical protein